MRVSGENVRMLPVCGRGRRRLHLPPAALGARSSSKFRAPAKVKGARECSRNHYACAFVESSHAAGACPVQVGAARRWMRWGRLGRIDRPCAAQGLDRARTLARISSSWHAAQNNIPIPSREPLKWGHQDNSPRVRHRLRRRLSVRAGGGEGGWGEKPCPKTLSARHRIATVCICTERMMV